MHYTISMTSRMLALAALCLFLLCVLLFLLGVELGKRFAAPPAAQPPVQSSAERVLPVDAAPILQAPASAPALSKP